MSWEKYIRVLTIGIGPCRANAIHSRKCIILYKKWQPIMYLERLNTSCCQKGCKGSHNHAWQKSGSKPQQWEESQHLCVQFTKASLSVCQHLPEGYRHDDFIVSLYLPQHWAISPDNGKTDCFLLTWRWPDRICPTVPTQHLSRSSMVRATPQGRAMPGGEGDLKAGRATPSPTQSPQYSSREEQWQSTDSPEQGEVICQVREPDQEL